MSEIERGPILGEQPSKEQPQEKQPQEEQPQVGPIVEEHPNGKKAKEVGAPEQGKTGDLKLQGETPSRESIRAELNDLTKYYEDILARLKKEKERIREEYKQKRDELNQEPIETRRDKARVLADENNIELSKITEEEKRVRAEYQEKRDEMLEKKR